MYLCAGFFIARKSVTTERPAGWGMTARWPPTLFGEKRAQQRCGETPGQEQKNDIQVDRQNITDKTKRDVAYCNEQEIPAMMEEIRKNRRTSNF